MAMADISQYTTVFRAQPAATSSSSTSTATDKQRRVIKRNRQPVSCTTCRLRKLKCDRVRPCGSCVKRGEEASCEFVAGSDGNNASNGNGNGSSAKSRRYHEEKSKSEAQLRLQRLEEMVNGLIHSGAAAGAGNFGTADGNSAAVNAHPSRSSFNGQKITDPQNGTAHDSSTAVTQCAGATTGGHLSRNGAETSYIGATHWTAILESIHDIQEYLDSDNDGFDADSSPEASASPSSHVDFVFGAMEPLTLADALAALPSRCTTDALLAVYFNSRFTCVPFLHSGRFQREYEAFLENPVSVSLIWMSMLFSTLSVGAKICDARGYPVLPEREGWDPIELMTKSAQCLVSGQYHKGGQPYALEALLLYANCMHVQNPDSDPNLWSLFGLATRMAQRMGYHRDPRHLNVSAFEGEIRRRVWFCVESFDILLSFQLGMPAIIHEEECDTESPGNFLDEDFDEENNSLPTPRPESEATSAVYFRHKSKLLRLLRLVIRHALATKQPVYEKTIKLDQDLHALHSELPACLRHRSIRTSGFTDQTYTIMHRLMLELLHLKSLCVLHRTYLSYEKDNPKFQFSREACRSAALQILDMQVEFDREINPGGRLYDDRWMLSSLAIHDFLLAAMIVCLDLVESNRQSDRQRELTALKNSYGIWLGRRHLSRDCAHASRVLTAILNKVSGQAPQSAAENWILSPPLSTGQVGTATSNVSEGYSAPLPDQGLFVPGQTKEQPDSMLDFMDFEPLDTVLNGTENLDWNLIDQYLRIDQINGNGQPST